MVRAPGEYWSEGLKDVPVLVHKCHVGLHLLLAGLGTQLSYNRFSEYVGGKTVELE